jgi:hypothetical protein
MRPSDKKRGKSMENVTGRKIKIEASEISDYEKSLGAIEKYIYTDLLNGDWFVTMRFTDDEWFTGPIYTQAYAERSHK